MANTAPAPGVGPYGLSVSVNEVDLTLHAADAQGLAVNDLKLEELSLLDNGQPPAKILAFESLQDLPIRAGILRSGATAAEIAASQVPKRET